MVNKLWSYPKCNAYKFISVFSEGFGVTNADWHSSFCQVNRLCDQWQPHPVGICRCIRPNDLRSRNHFQLDKVIIQLRYTGVIETTVIRKQVCKHLCVCLCVCLSVCVREYILYVCMCVSLSVCPSILFYLSVCV